MALAQSLARAAFYNSLDKSEPKSPETQAAPAAVAAHRLPSGAGHADAMGASELWRLWIPAEKVTPYSLGATEAFDMVFNGGKQDDITVVVATL